MSITGKRILTTIEIMVIILTISLVLKTEFAGIFENLSREEFIANPLPFTYVDTNLLVLDENENLVPMRRVMFAQMDTIKSIKILSSNKSDLDFFVFLISDLPYGRKMIVIENHAGGVLGRVILPLSDEEVKNFYPKDIEVIEDGFKLLTILGGGNWYYENDYIFNVNDSGVYFTERHEKLHQYVTDEMHENNYTFKELITENGFELLPFILE